MPRIPRDINGRTLCKLLGRYGYRVTRQSGSHIRLTSSLHGNDHHVTIPEHDPIKIGTLGHILGDIADYLKVSRDALVKELFT